MRGLRTLLLIAAVGAAAAIGWATLGRASRDGEAARAAVVAMGAGEFVVRRAEVSPCAGDQTAWAFIAQGGRLGRETSGYVCVGPGGAVTREGPLDDAETVDWH